jgi:hypothetical protein
MGGKKRMSSNKHAAEGKKRKSSNKRDSRLSGITPSSHVAAASAASSLRTATVSAATNAVLLDDDVVDFCRSGYDDDCGNWDGGDVSTLTAGGACASMDATTAGNTHNNLKGYDSDVIYVPSIASRDEDGCDP